MAREFPHVEFKVRPPYISSHCRAGRSNCEADTTQAVDVAPLQIDENLPDNYSFAFEDLTTTLGFPDNYFDATHCRLLVAGVSSYPIPTSPYLPGFDYPHGLTPCTDPRLVSLHSRDCANYQAGRPDGLCRIFR